MKSRCSSLLAHTVFNFGTLFIVSVWICPVYSGDIGIWAVPSRQIPVPNGYYISETIFTLNNVSVFGGDSSCLSVYLMPDKTSGFYGLPNEDYFQDNNAASFGLSLAEFKPNDVINNILRIRLSSLTNPILNSPHLGTPLNLQFQDGSSASISPAILQLMDYLGSSPSIAFGFHSKGFSFDSFSILVICRSYTIQQGTRTFLLNSGNLRPPVLQSLPEMSTTEGQEIAFTLSASDSDNDSLSYYSPNLPNGAVLSGNQFTWTPSWTQAGNYCIRFVVSDGKSSDYIDMQLTVDNSNQPPVFSSVAAQSGQVRKLLSFPVIAQDPQGDPVTITPVNLPEGSIFQSNQFSWIPGTNQTGKYEVVFIASDGSLQTQQTVAIDISTSSTASGTYFVF